MENYKTAKIKIKFNNTVQKSVISFDTETTTVFSDDGKNWEGFDRTKPEGYYVNKLKQSFMYVFAFCIDGVAFYGRTGQDLVECLEMINKAAKGKKVIIYVHNLNYDFQSIRSFIDIDEVFAKDKRNLLYAISKRFNIVFRCSYNLSGLKLEDIPAVYHTETKKKTGGLDYEKVRTYSTELTATELEYIENDVKIVCEYIQKEAEEAGSISKIALTKTGKVRKLFKKKLKESMGQYYFRDWTEYISRMNDTNLETFMALNEAAAGGYVHANMDKIGKIIKGHSYDERSCYPAKMLTEMFPMGLFEKTDEAEDFESFCYLYHVKMYNIRSTCKMTFLSLSSCIWADFDTKIDNGRILSSSEVELYMTDVDFCTFLRCYECDDGFEILEKWKAKKDYLPRILLEFIIDCYKEKEYCKKMKNQAKGTKEEKYWDIRLNNAKRNLNSIFGMTMTKIAKKQEDIWKNGRFETIENSMEDFQAKLFNLDGSVYFSFSWGVWVMSYARRSLFEVIEKEEDKVAYCDTDCVKSEGVIDLTWFNNELDRKLQEMGEHYGMDVSDIIGIGHFVDETPDGMKFKTLGQKKYICEINGVMKCVAAGVAPDSVAEEIGNDFDRFKEGMVFGFGAGCVNVSYNDEQTDMVINGEKISQRFGCSIYPARFKLKSSIIENMEVV